MSARFAHTPSGCFVACAPVFRAGTTVCGADAAGVHCKCKNKKKGCEGKRAVPGTRTRARCTENTRH
eukprot:1083138-Rhodomonas_salina.1